MQMKWIARQQRMIRQLKRVINSPVHHLLPHLHLTETSKRWFKRLLLPLHQELPQLQETLLSRELPCTTTKTAHGLIHYSPSHKILFMVIIMLIFQVAWC